MRIWSEIAGDGPPVLLVHAGICDSRMWEPQWRSFPPRHRTIRCDLRGFGRTPIPPGRFSHSADLAELVESLELGAVVVVGASFGGLVALDLALARPELVATLVLVGAPLPDHDWSERVRAAWRAEDAALERGDLDAAVEANLRIWVDGPSRGPEESDSALRARVGVMQRRAFELQLPVIDEADDELTTEDLGNRLGEIAVPTLAVAGDLDVDDIRSIADRLAAEIPGAERARIGAASHLPSLARPAQFDRLVLGFLAAQGSATSSRSDAR